MLPAFLFSITATAQSIHKAKVCIEAVPFNKGEVEPVIMGDIEVKKTTSMKGVVKDEAGLPVIGVTIMVKGTNHGIASDTAGRFLLKEVQTPPVLAFSSAGYISQELHLAPGQGEVNVLMNVQMLTGTLGMVSVVTVKSSRRKTKSAKELSVAIPASLSAYPNPLQASQALKLRWEVWSLVTI